MSDETKRWGPEVKRIFYANRHRIELTSSRPWETALWQDIVQSLESAHAAGVAEGLEKAAVRLELGFERNDLVQDMLDDMRAMKSPAEQAGGS